MFIGSSEVDRTVKSQETVIFVFFPYLIYLPALCKSLMKLNFEQLFEKCGNKFQYFGRAHSRSLPTHKEFFPWYQSGQNVIRLPLSNICLSFS